MKHDTNLVKYAVMGMHMDGYSARDIANHLEIPLLRVRAIVDPEYIAQKREEARRKSVDRAFKARMKQQAIESALPPAPKLGQREMAIQEMMDIRNYDKYSEERSYSNMVQRLNKKMARAV